MAVVGPTPLDVSPPPPRVVVPPSTDIVDPPAAPSTPAPIATPPRPDVKPTARPEKPATTTTAPPTPEVVPAPPIETTADVSSLELQTKTLIANAHRDLDRINKSSLSADARAQYDRAQGFVKQAENAMGEKNLTYARNMAEKAAALASQLPKTR